MISHENLLLYDGRQLANHSQQLIGADEVGRGALAGPVVAGAVWIDRDFFEQNKDNPDVLCFQDSKRLTEKQREAASCVLKDWTQSGHLQFAIGEGSVEEIDTLNILNVTTLAFGRALESLQKKVGFSLPRTIDLNWGNVSETIYIQIDGLPLKNLPYLHKNIVKGDRKSFCIAAASIVAKVYRDRHMRTLAADYPGYHFEENKGYGTTAHLAALQKLGPCKLHRITFLKKILTQTTSPSLQQTLDI